MNTTNSTVSSRPLCSQFIHQKYPIILREGNIISTNRWTRQFINTTQRWSSGICWICNKTILVGRVSSFFRISFFLFSNPLCWRTSGGNSRKALQCLIFYNCGMILLFWSERCWDSDLSYTPQRCISAKIELHVFLNRTELFIISMLHMSLKDICT